MTRWLQNLLVITVLTASATAWADNGAYRLEDVLLPLDMSPEISAVTFSPTGRLFVANRHGDVWSMDTQTKQWRRFAHGLHEPLGMVVTSNSDVYVCHKPELTRLRDTTGDGQADRYDTVAAGWSHTDNWHEHVFGLHRDQQGQFVIGFGLTDQAGPINLLWPRTKLDFTLVSQEKKLSLGPHQGWVVKISPSGKVIPFASGFREPSGVGISPEGEIFITDQQGDYIGSSPLIHVEEGKFYGHPASYKWSPEASGRRFTDQELAERRTPPSLILPHGSMGGSPGEPVWDTTGGKFGPFSGQIFIGDFTKLVSRCDLEKVAGQWQGACFSFLRDAVGELAVAASSGGSNLTVPAGGDGKKYFRDVAPRAGVPLRQGSMRMAFAPDGSLYLGQTTRGWGQGDGLQRVVWTGARPVDMHSMRLTTQGFRVAFTTAMQRDALAQRSNYRMERFRYVYHHNYGSPRLDVAEVDLQEIKINDSGDVVELVLPELHPGYIYELLLENLTSVDGQPLRYDHAYYSLNCTHDGRKYEGEITAGSGLPLAAEKPRPPDAKLGRRVYQTFCVQCHQADGRGGGLPGIGAADFTRPDGALSRSDDLLAKQIAGGIPGKTMPQFGFVLTQQQISDVLAFIRDEFAEPSPAAK